MADRAQGSVTEGKGKNNFDDHTISAIIKVPIWCKIFPDSARKFPILQ